MTANDRGEPKYVRVAAAVRGQIADGTLRPGQPAPSGAALSRVTGFSTLTCRKALRVLMADGVLTPGPSRNARPRVASPAQPPAERDLAAAGRSLASGLSGRRRVRGLTQPELARRVGVSVTTVGHAETGRLWQSRRFWERADTVLAADGGLLRLHDAYRAAAASGAATAALATATVTATAPATTAPATTATGNGTAGNGTAGNGTAGNGAAGFGATAGVPGQRGEPGAAPRPAAQADTPAAPAAPRRTGPARVTIVWGDGTVTTVHQPQPRDSLTDVP